MKATLKFNFPEDLNDFKMACRSSDYWRVLWDLTETFLRRKVSKGEHDYKTADEALEAVWDEIWRLLEDHGCPIDDIS